MISFLLFKTKQKSTMQKRFSCASNFASIQFADRPYQLILHFLLS
jgi:hypothetical protein